MALALTDLRLGILQTLLVAYSHIQLVISPTTTPSWPQLSAFYAAWKSYRWKTTRVGGQSLVPFGIILNSSGIGQLQVRRQVTIGTLSCEILLEIFDFCMDEPEGPDDNWWRTLVHVCRRWRNVVFTSLRRLNLQLLCTRTRSVGEMLDIWPELPIIVEDYDGSKMMQDADNLIAALKLNDRVSRINLWRVSSSELKTFAAVMQDPFPALTDLLVVADEMAPVISDSFLGGSAPRLQYLVLEGIPFPALPGILLSATDLVDLQLKDLPHSGYISPEAMVTCLSTLARLESLILEFQSPRSRPNRASQFPPPPTRTILPSLTYLHFKGVTEYLEDLVTQIDVPLLEYISITFFNQLIFDMSQLPEFLCRTEKFKILDRADVFFLEDLIIVKLSLQTGADTTRLQLGISCRKLDWQLSSLAQVCDSALPTLSALEGLNLGPTIYAPDLLPGQDEIENTQWLDVLRPFTNVKDVHLSKQVAPCIAPALQELTDEGIMITEVLPALQNVFLDSFESS